MTRERLDEDEIISTVRSHARRVTAAKRALAHVLAGSTHHLTVDEITLAVQRRLPDVSLSTVYRILEEFEELNIVVHTHLGQPAAVYHLAGPVHGHLTCDSCQTTEEIPSGLFDELSRRVLTGFGFRLDRHHLALSGTCAHCASPGPSAAPPSEAPSSHS